MDTNTIITATPNQYEIMLNNYASIVEKTNNQLGLGINLATLAVAILSILIAVIAIFVAFALWKSSKEQKDKIIHFFSEQEKIIKEKNKKIELKFNNLINEYEKKLKNVNKTDKESKKQIQQAIDELKKEKISVGAHLEPVSGLKYLSTLNMDAIDSPFGNILGSKSMVCSKCGKSFKYFDDQPYKITIDGQRVYCTHCGALNIARDNLL